VKSILEKMNPMLEAVNKVILDPKYHTILSILKGTRNGIVYGAKIRFPHALVMTFLFGSGSAQSKLEKIYEATYTHAKNLGTFVFVYKSLMALQKYVEGKEKSHHAFFAGLVGGYFVFGNYSNINYQIVLYLFSRIIIGLAKMITEKQKIQAPNQSYPIFAAIVWGIVMWLFRYERHTLQQSLQASMEYLYIDSNNWNSLRNLVWHNK